MCIQKFADKLYHSSLKCFLVGFTDDYCRVKLTEIQGEEGSDYINASIMDVRLQLKMHWKCYRIIVQLLIRLICLAPQFRDIIARGHTLLHKVGCVCKYLALSHFFGIFKLNTSSQSQQYRRIGFNCEV